MIGLLLTSSMWFDSTPHPHTLNLFENFLKISKKELNCQYEYKISLLEENKTFKYNFNLFNYDVIRYTYYTNKGILNIPSTIPKEVFLL